MAKLSNDIKLNSLGELTLNVSLSRPLRFRVWIALSLIRLSMWIIGAKTQVKFEEQ